MRRAGNLSTRTAARALLGPLIVCVAGTALLAGCSSSSTPTARHVTTVPRATASTTATRTTPKPTTAPLVTYHVRRGDSLTTIAKHFHVPIAAIVFANHLTDPDRLAEGRALKIPPKPSLNLVVTPPRGPQGRRFEIDLIGASPAEVIRFEIDSPAGKHRGPAHTATADGSVTTRYQTSLLDPTGQYRVIGKGNKGTNVKATFVLVKGR